MSSTVTFYIVRHGKTMLNTLDRVQGWCDSPLTEEGIEFAGYLGKGLRDIKFESVFCSTLRRTLQTAQVILKEQGQTDLPITELEGFKEAGFGTYEGDFNHRMWKDAAFYLHYTSIEELMKAVALRKVSTKMTLDAIAAIEPSGRAETFDQVEQRTQDALTQIGDCESRKENDSNVLVIAHGMSIISMLENIGGSDLLKGHIENVSVSKVIYKDGKFTVESVGDMTYMHNGRKMA